MIAIFVAILGSILANAICSAWLFARISGTDSFGVLLASTGAHLPDWCFFCLTLFFWRCRFSIFLDVICIDQKDETRKAKGIISMGAILKSSDSILVLWDSSYSSRLWCVWEPWMNEACFLKDFQELEVTVVMVQDT